MSKSSALKFVAPQLCKLVDEPPEGQDWLYEIKFDGYRIEALIEKGKVRLMTRNRQDWTDRYPAIVKALRGLDVERAAIDGEIVAIDRKGLSDFGLLARSGRSDSTTLRYCVFDLLHLDGRDLRREPLTERKKRLRKLVKGAGQRIRYTGEIRARGDKAYADACRKGLEGIICKRADASYRSGRGTSWQKCKCLNNDEFVIAGYRKSDKQGRPFASLLLGEYVDGQLAYRGGVGTGFDDRTLHDLSARMKRLERKTCPFGDVPKAERRQAIWLTPKLVAQVAYTEETEDGKLRHPSFLGLREDKPAKQVKAAKG